MAFSSKQNRQHFFVKDMLRTEFREFSFFVPRNEIPSCFLFRGMVQNRIPRVCFYFCSMYRILSIFLLCVTVRNGIPRVFCSAEQPEFRRNKPIVPSSVFRGIIFCRILPTLVVILFYCCGTAQLIILPPNSRKAHQLIESAERGADSLITSCCTQCLKVILR
jgi:hypothetical protein